MVFDTPGIFSAQTPLMKCYTEIYETIANEDVGLESPAFQDESLLRKKAEFDLRKLGDVSGKQVLEVGPGWGHLSLLLERSNAVVSVSDLVPQYVDRLSPKIRGDVFLHDIQEPIWDRQFDVVIMCDVLEHLFRPADALLSARKALRPGGLLYVRTPAHESLIGYARSLGAPYEIVHLRTYTSALLRRELKAAGFESVRNAGTIPNVRRLPKSRISGEWYWKHERPRSSNEIEETEPTYSGFREKMAHLVVRGEKPRRFSWAFRALHPLTLFLSDSSEIAFTGRRPAA